MNVFRKVLLLISSICVVELWSLDMMANKSLENVLVFPHAPVRGKLMYSPSSGVEYLAALYTTWNILDALMTRYNYGCNDKSPVS